MSARRLSTLSRPARLMAATLVLAVAGGLALTAKAALPYGGHGEHGFGGPMAMMGSPHRLERMLDAVDASADQRSQIKTILDAARADLRAQHEAGRSLHEQAMQLFAQPTVDARAAEALRQQMLAQHDHASQRMMQAMLDVSRVLTPEQRQQIVGQMAQHRAMMEHRRAAPGASDTPTK